jgi:hypothetical protein
MREHRRAVRRRRLQILTALRGTTHAWKNPSANEDSSTLDMVLLFSMPVIVAIIWYLGAHFGWADELKSARHEPRHCEPRGSEAR